MSKHASDYKPRPRPNAPKPNPASAHFVFLDIPALYESTATQA